MLLHRDELIIPICVRILSLSRAKIKTVKLTVAVIGLYIICSAPYICVQLWSAYETPPEAVSKFLTFSFY